MKLLRYGSVGPQVELVQLALQREGALREAPDGIFGARTREAVVSFQRRRGLAADGIVGNATWQALTPWLSHCPFLGTPGEPQHPQAGEG